MINQSLHSKLSGFRDFLKTYYGNQKLKTPLVLYLLLLGLLSSCEKDAPLKTIPWARFSTDTPSIVSKGETIQFTNDSKSAASYLWDFGDGNTSTEKEPNHFYNKSGSYSVVLNAINGIDTSTCSREIFVKDITVMTYNIAFSGGAVTELYDMWQTDNHGAWNFDRRPELLKIIRSVDPDILGLQEAWLWDYYDPKVYERFADSLGMEYYHYLEYEEVEWNGICIYSKFPIESTDFMLHQSCVQDRVWNGTFMVKTVLRIDSATTLDLFTCHLMVQVRGAQTCEVELLNDYLSNGVSPYTILMGDMNYRSGNFTSNYNDPHSNVVEYYDQLLSDIGLYDLKPQQGYNGPINIDQIWSSEKLFDKSKVFDMTYSTEQEISPEIEQILDIASDHYPVVAYFALE